MRYALLVTAIACALVPGTAPRASGDAAAAEFFNGKDLAGWAGLKRFWSVKDGALVGSTFPKGNNFNTFLCSRRDYRNFELTFQVKLRGEGWTGNSGVQIRSAIFSLERMAVRGPQCDMGDVYWGSLYGEGIGGMLKQSSKDVVTKVLKPDDFNDYSIRCVGPHVTIKLNGETTVDGDFPTMRDTGLIAWQLHGGPPMEVTFRNIAFKELPAKP